MLIATGLIPMYFCDSSELKGFGMSLVGGALWQGAVHIVEGAPSA